MLIVDVDFKNDSLNRESGLRRDFENWIETVGLRIYTQGGP